MQKDKKERVLIVSDLWGKEKSNWINYYLSVLEDQFDVQYYDSCVLGEIDTSEYAKDKLHAQFINGGIDKAVENLLLQENENCMVLGFSIGGCIAWKAANLGLKVESLIAVSSTRLRYEIKKPAVKIKLIYGQEDANKPDGNWFSNMQISANFYQNEDHELYRKKECADKICKSIIDHKF